MPTVMLQQKMVYMMDDIHDKLYVKCDYFNLVCDNVCINLTIFLNPFITDMDSLEGQKPLIFKESVVFHRMHQK